MSNKTQGTARVTSEAKRYSDNAYNKRLKDAVMAHYGNSHCSNCDYVGDALQLHHVDGDGAAHRAATVNGGKGSGRNLYIWLRRHNFPCYPRMEVLCATCHVEEHARRRACATSQ